MRVLLVHNAYGKRSGEEVVVDQQSELLASQGHVVERFERTSEGVGSNLIAQSKAFFAALGNRCTLETFGRAVSRFGPDVIHVHNLYPWISPAILPIAHASGAAVVMSVHNFRLLCPNGLMFTHGEPCERCVPAAEYWCVLRNCERSVAKSTGYALRNYVARRRRWYLDNVDRFAVLTGFQQRKLVAAGYPVERIALLPNTAEVRDADDTAGEADCVGFIGRVSPEKGSSVLIDAMKKLDTVECRIAGAFDRQPELPGRAPGNVEFLGMLGKPELARLFLRLRIVVVPSVCYEGFPMSVVEAMAHGRPVIASRIGGIPEIVEDGVTGLLCEPGNADDLAEKIRYLWDRPELCRQMGEAGRDKAALEYNKARYYERLMAIYQDAIASRT